MTSSNSRIDHLTSIRPLFYTRIFQKMYRSLAKYGYSVSLVVADGKGDEKREGANIIDSKAFKGGLDIIHNALDLVLFLRK